MRTAVVMYWMTPDTVTSYDVSRGMFGVVSVM